MFYGKTILKLNTIEIDRTFRMIKSAISLKEKCRCVLRSKLIGYTEFFINQE